MSRVRRQPDPAPYTPVHIRWLIRRDMPEVLAIDAASFPAPTSEDEFAIQLRQRNCIGMVAEHSESIVGFMLYELHPRRIKLLTLAVAPQHRQRYVGTQMICRLASKLSPNRRTRLVADVPERNVAAQLWLKAIGWHATAVLRGQGDDGDDAYRLVYRVRAGAPLVPELLAEDRQ